ARHENVLVRDGYAGEGLRRPLGDALVGRARLRETFFRVDGDEGVERAVQLFNALEEEPGQLDAGDFPLRERGRKLFERGVQHGIQDSGPTVLAADLAARLWSAIRSPSEPDRVPAPFPAPAIGIAPAGLARSRCPRASAIRGPVHATSARYPRCRPSASARSA